MQTEELLSEGSPSTFLGWFPDEAQFCLVAPLAIFKGTTAQECSEMGTGFAGCRRCVFNQPLRQFCAH